MNLIDFTPSWYRSKMESVRNRRRRLGFLTVIFMLMICWFFINEGRIQTARAELDISRQTYQQAQLLRQRLESLRTQKRNLLQLQTRYESLGHSVPPSVVFAEISHRIPENACLGAFQLQPTEGADHNAGRSGRRASRDSRAADHRCQYGGFYVTLKAQAMERNDLVTFIEALRESPLFEEVFASATHLRPVGGMVVKENEIQLCVLGGEFIEP